MSNIVLARIDDRLIHGQVMTAWVQYTGGNEIIIADDQVAKDPFLSSVISGAVPKNLIANVMTVKDAGTYLVENAENNTKKFIILAKNPATFNQLIDAGVMISDINLGGIGSKQGRSQLYKNISASEEEREMFQEIQNKNVNVYIQVVPNSEQVSLSKYL